MDCSVEAAPNERIGSPIEHRKEYRTANARRRLVDASGDNYRGSSLRMRKENDSAGQKSERTGIRPSKRVEK